MRSLVGSLIITFFGMDGELYVHRGACVSLFGNTVSRSRQQLSGSVHTLSAR